MQQGASSQRCKKRVDHFETILTLVNTVEYLEHKQYIEREIEGLRNRIEYEKKRDFIEN